MSQSQVSQIWERQPYDLTEQQWLAFAAFRDMQKPRSVDGAYRIYLAKKRGVQIGDESVAKKRAIGGWQNWSRGRNWKGRSLKGALTWEERVTAYDSYLDRLAQDKFETELIERRQQAIRNELEDADAQLVKWRAMFNLLPIAEDRARDWATLSRWRGEIGDQMRRALGMPITRADVTTGGEKLPGSTVINVDDFAELFKQIQQHKEAEHDAGS